MFKRETASSEHEKENPRQGRNGQAEQESLIQANPGDWVTILFITGIAQFCGIVTIWIPVTAKGLKDALLAIGTRPPIRVLNSWEISVTLALAEGVGHVTAVVTQGLILGAASKAPPYATVVVAWEERQMFRAK